MFNDSVRNSLFTFFPSSLNNTQRSQYDDLRTMRSFWRDLMM